MINKINENFRESLNEFLGNLADLNSQNTMLVNEFATNWEDVLNSKQFKVKLVATVSIERNVDKLTEDVKQSMIEELHDSVVGQCFNSQNFEICYGVKNKND